MWNYCVFGFVCILCCKSLYSKLIPQCHINNNSYHERTYSSQSKTEQTILDLFVIIAKPQEYQYILRSEFWLNFKLIKLLAKNRNEEIRFHIFTDTPWIVSQGIEQGYHMYEFSKMKKLDDHFMNMYKFNHHSINSIEYEYLCFYRWHVYRHVIENWVDKTKPIVNIITMDSDVIISVNPVEYYFKTIQTLGYQNSSQFELIVVAPGAMHLWSSHGLIAYSDYIYDWYNKDVHTVEENTKKVAGYLYKQLHFSDMQMVIAFMTHNPSKRTGCYVSVATSSQSKRSEGDKRLLSLLGCIPMGRYNDVMEGTTFSVLNNGQISARGESLPFCFMHFQGDGIKHFMKLFARYLIDISSGIVADSGGGVSKSVPDAAIVEKVLREPLFIKSTKQYPDIYILYGDNTKHLIPDMATFNAVRFSNHTIKDVPQEVMALFKTGPAIVSSLV